MNRQGRILVLLLLLSGLVGSLVHDSPIYPRLLYLAVLLIVSSWLWTRLTLRAMRLTRRARTLRARVGDIFQENFEIHNTGRLPCLWLEVRNESPLRTATGSRLLTRIGGRQRRSYTVRTWLLQRGRYPLGPTRIQTGDPFGLFRAEKRIPATQSLTVLPASIPLQRFMEPPGLLPGGRITRRKALDVTPHAAGVREYIPGDPMKRIHWPTTARRGRLMVKEFEQDPQAEVWLILDAQARVHAARPDESPPTLWDGWFFGTRPRVHLPPSTMEYAVTIAASLAQYFVRQKRAVGLITAGRVHTVLPAERSERQIGKILETLAFVQAEGDLPLSSLIAAQAGQLPQGSSAILITPSTQSDLLVTVDELQRRQLRPVVILLDASTFGGTRGSEALATSLQNYGVPVCLIPFGADLAQALSSLTDDSHLRRKQYVPNFHPYA
ncbi:MAG: DUF58 domain-containing protein [Anaerolineae bacterium]|nr:MAG: DUF58 domain-containing protein [Anaerolineae bacterium]